MVWMDVSYLVILLLLFSFVRYKCFIYLFDFDILFFGIGIMCFEWF